MKRESFINWEFASEIFGKEQIPTRLRKTMSKPQFFISLSVPGTSFKGTIKTGVLLPGPDSHFNVREHLPRLVYEFHRYAARVLDSEETDWDVIREEWQKHYEELIK